MTSHYNSLYDTIFNNETDAKTRIIATGGASANKTILQILSDIFNTPVYTQVCIFIYLYV